MPIISDLQAAILVYLQARYSVTNGDLTTLVRRYLSENPNSRDDAAKVFIDLITAASA
jgi:hypothetical protein